MYVRTYVCMCACVCIRMHACMDVYPPSFVSICDRKNKIFELHEDATAEADDTPLVIGYIASTIIGVCVCVYVCACVCVCVYIHT